MGLFDKIKEAGDKTSNQLAKSYKEHQAKVTKVKEARGDLLGSISLEYIGGYNDKRKAKGLLTFYQKQTEFNSPLSTKFSLKNNHIKNIAIEGKDEVSRRVTVTRLLAVGIFAFALKKKKKEKEAYLTIELSDGPEIIFFVDNKSPMDLKAKLAKAISQVKQEGAKQAHTAESSANNTADELEKYAKLKQKGIITQEEFETKKKQILGI
jgi:hypothetical protein